MESYLSLALARQETGRKIYTWMNGVFSKSFDLRDWQLYSKYVTNDYYLHANPTEICKTGHKAFLLTL